MLFKYKGYEKSGKKVSGKIEASDLNNAKAKLKQKKIIFNYLEETSQPLLSSFKFDSRSKIAPDVLSNISKTLSIYLESGISLLNAMKLIKESYKENKKMLTFFDSVIALLDEGKNFYTSLETQKTLVIPEFYLQSVKISEDGGILQGVLLELSVYIDEEQRIKKQVSQAMTYPVFIILFAIGVIAFMLTFIVPKITGIFEQNGQELPGITSFVINSGDFMAAYYHIIFLFLLSLYFVYQLAVKKVYSFRYSKDKFKLKVPVYGSLIEMNELSRFSYMNAILLKSGVTVVQAFKMGANIVDNSVIRCIFEEASKKVVEGEKLSRVLETNKRFKIDRAFIQAIAIGEETSELSRVLQNIAKLYTDNTKDKMGKFLQILQPMLILIVGGIIGFIVVAMLLPILSMSIG
jgi:general secretion pathway protein F/type IV pilus assembly protein PilC